MEPLFVSAAHHHCDPGSLNGITGPALPADSWRWDPPRAAPREPVIPESAPALALQRKAAARPEASYGFAAHRAHVPTRSNTVAPVRSRISGSQPGPRPAGRSFGWAV